MIQVAYVNRLCQLLLLQMNPPRRTPIQTARAEKLLKKCIDNNTPVQCFYFVDCDSSTQQAQAYQYCTYCVQLDLYITLHCYISMCPIQYYIIVNTHDTLYPHVCLKQHILHSRQLPQTTKLKQLSFVDSVCSFDEGILKSLPCFRYFFMFFADLACIYVLFLIILSMTFKSVLTYICQCSNGLKLSI